MKNINVLIVEDKKIESDALIEVLEANGFTVYGVARTHAQALQLYQSPEIDVIVIDVFLGDNPDGIAFAETLSISPNRSKPYVFLTSSKDRGIFERAKLTKPYAFLLKPFNELEVMYALEMALEKYFDQTNGFEGLETGTVLSEDHMFIKKNGALKKVITNDIIYIEVEERYCNIFTEHEKFVVHITLTRIESILKDKSFVRTHRKFLVNQSKIIQIRLSESTIVLEGNISVSLGESYKDFIKKINILS
jgi:two-component system LytT family response regulator